MVEAFRQLSPQPLLLLGQAPDCFVLQLQELDPTAILLQDQLALSELSRQVVGVDLNASLYGLGNQILRLLLEVSAPKEERNDCLGSWLSGIGSNWV